MPEISKERIRELASDAKWHYSSYEKAVRLGIREGLEVAARALDAKTEKCRDIEADSGALGFDVVSEHLVSCASVLEATGKDIRAITIEGER